MGGQEGRGAGVRQDAAQVLQQPAPGGGIQGREGLVQQEQLRAQGEGPGQGRALGLAAGEVAGGAVQEPGDAELRGGGLHPVLAFFGVHAVQPQARRDVLAHRGVEEEGVLEHHGHPAAVGLPLRLGVQDLAVEGQGACGWLQ